MNFQDAVSIVQKRGYHLIRKSANSQVFEAKEEKEMTPEEKLAEAKRIVTQNGLRFVKESKKYAGNHKVIDSKEFQAYLLKECGTGCEDGTCTCTCVNGDCECECDEEVTICPECGGEGCEECNFQGYIDTPDPVDEIPDTVYNDIDDFDIANDDETFAYGPDDSEAFADDMSIQSFNNIQRGRGPLY